MIHEKDVRHQSLVSVAQKMMIAARTAPKARGKDHLEICILQNDEILNLAQKMIEIGTAEENPTFLRDGENVKHATVLVLLGTKIESMKLKTCGMCGFKNCHAKDEHPSIPCVFNTGDLGVALGSALRVAMDHCVDNRVMYTVGQAALALNVFDPSCKIIYGIPLSCTGKNPFFDRK